MLPVNTKFKYEKQVFSGQTKIKQQKIISSIYINPGRARMWNVNALHCTLSVMCISIYLSFLMSYLKCPQLHLKGTFTLRLAHLFLHFYNFLLILFLFVFYFFVLSCLCALVGGQGAHIGAPACRGQRGVLNHFLNHFPSYLGTEGRVSC